METLLWLTNLKYTEPSGWHLVIEDKNGNLLRLQPCTPHLAAYMQLSGVPIKSYESVGDVKSRILVVS